MNIRRRVIGAVFALVVLLSCFSGGVAGQTVPASPVNATLDPQLTKDPRPQIQIFWEPAESAWRQPSKDQAFFTINSLMQKISAIPANTPLTPAMVKQITAIYGPDGNLTGYDGSTYQGSKEIALYLEQLLCCHQVSNLKIEIKLVYVKEFTDRLYSPRVQPTDIVHTLYYILSNSYMMDGHRVVPPGSTICAHQTGCSCR